MPGDEQPAAPRPPSPKRPPAARRKANEPQPDPWWAQWLVPFVGYAITLVWAASFVLSVFDRHFTPPAGLQALMMVVAGSIFALPVLRNRFPGGRQ